MRSFSMFLWILAFCFLVGCSTTQQNQSENEQQLPPKKEMTQEKPETAPSVPQETKNATVSEEFKTKLKKLLEEKKFFMVYQELSRYEPKNDWIVANLLFISHVLKQLEGSDVVAAKDAEEKREQAKQLLERGKYHEALDILATLNPKTDQDIAYGMAAAYSLFKDSGGKQISVYLSSILIGFVHARVNQNKKLERECTEALEKIGTEDIKLVDKEEYKKSLVEATKFFEGMRRDFKELVDRHLLSSGFAADEVYSTEANVRKLLQQKSEEGDKHSQILLWWYDCYAEFKVMTLKLLMQSAGQ